MTASTVAVAPLSDHVPALSASSHPTLNKGPDAVSKPEVSAVDLARCRAASNPPLTSVLTTWVGERRSRGVVRSRVRAFVRRPRLTITSP